MTRVKYKENEEIEIVNTNYHLFIKKNISNTDIVNISRELLLKLTLRCSLNLVSEL